jgi:hypothetical protein
VPLEVFALRRHAADDQPKIGIGRSRHRLTVPTAHAPYCSGIDRRRLTVPSPLLLVDARPYPQTVTRPAGVACSREVPVKIWSAKALLRS